MATSTRRASAAPTSVASLDFTPGPHVFPSPPDWRDLIIYELMVDRFDDNRRHPPFRPKRTDRGRNPEEGTRFQGGNLKGVTRRLDYLRDMGVSALWITSPLKGRADDPSVYHGYGPQNFLAID